MIIPEHIREKLNCLYSNRFLAEEEISSLKNWLVGIKSDPQMEAWLSANWELAANEDVDISFEEIQRRIRMYEKRSKTRRIKHVSEITQKVAAVLLLPLLIFSVWLMIGRLSDSSVMTLATAKGERTHVFLPDGSEIWLNVDSRLEYSTDFNRTNRSLKLAGEAFFKVAKGNKYPFMVDARNFQIKAIGTEFNISAYNDETHATTFLKEGIVELSYFPENKKEQKLQMNPGERATINLDEESINILQGVSGNSVKWTDGELYFENEQIDQVFHKVERWYNVKIKYKLNEFKGETLVLNLKKGESIDRFFQIVDEVIGINVKQNGEEYIISRK